MGGQYKIVRIQGFSLKEVSLKNPKAEQRESCSLAFGVCEVSEASVHKLANARGCFEGSRQYILSCEKTTPRQIPSVDAKVLVLKMYYK